MFSTAEAQYDLRKPPILLISRRVQFVCEICARKGWGPPNIKVHPGRCREEHTRRIAAKTAAKRKEKKLAHAVEVSAVAS